MSLFLAGALTVWGQGTKRISCLAAPVRKSESVRAGRKISRNQRQAARTRSAQVRGGAGILGGARLRPPPASTVNSPESACAIVWLFLDERRQQRPALGLSNAETLRYAPAHFWGHACEAAWSSEGESRDAAFGGWRRGDSTTKAKLTPIPSCNWAHGIFSPEIRIGRSRKGK